MLNSAKIIQAVQMRYLRKNRGWGGGGGGGGRAPLGSPGSATGNEGTLSPP